MGDGTPLDASYTLTVRPLLFYRPALVSKPAASSCVCVCALLMQRNANECQQRIEVPQVAAEDNQQLATFRSASQHDRWAAMMNLVAAWLSRKVFVCPPKLPTSLSCFAERCLFRCDCCKMGSSTLLMELHIFSAVFLYTDTHTHIHLYIDNNH